MMRKLPLALFVTGTLVACGSKMGTGGGGGGDDDGNPPDASVQPDPNAAFEVISKDAVLAPGDQITYCYYFHTSNTTDVLINKWVSDMTPGSHHAILFLNPSGQGQEADGTLDSSGNCGGVSLQSGAPVWTYATQTVHQEEDLPADDGAGKPLAQKIAANTPAVLQLHYLNASDQQISAHIDLKAYALPAGTAFTQTDAYVTYNQDIKIPPHAVGKSFTGSCDLPAGVKFWTMSTHSHKQSVNTVVDDGANAIFTSTDWEHPGAMNWMTPATFYTFTNSKLTWTCTYDNTGDNANNEVDSGTSASTNEMCMATGYFFPSTGPKFNVEYMGSCFSL